MTGMEDDGGKGMLDMKEAGAYTIARDEATSFVFSMSPESAKPGGVDKVYPLEKIVWGVLRACEG